MPLEIERKFLVSGHAWRTADGVSYRQGYLNRDKQRTVRVRIAGDRAFLTIKGVSSGATRMEFEYEIPVAEAAQLLTLCDGPLIEKTRHRLTVGAHVWEVDEFHGDNAGLVVAEIELGSEDEAFERPDWVTVEVTEDARYYNSNLAVRPFRTWSES
jgi:adenylate cyclase